MGAFLSCLPNLFPCMSGQPRGNDEGHTIVTIKSNSACCRGRVVELHLNEHQVQGLNELIAGLLQPPQPTPVQLTPVQSEIRDTVTI